MGTTAEQEAAIGRAIAMLQKAGSVYREHWWLTNMLADFSMCAIDLLRVGYSLPEARALLRNLTARLVQAKRRSDLEAEEAPTGEFPVPDELRRKSQRTHPPEVPQ